VKARSQPAESVSMSVDFVSSQNIRAAGQGRVCTRPYVWAGACMAIGP
jgi:hypothetical protein